METEPECGDWQCPDCLRVWYPSGKPWAPWASRDRMLNPQSKKFIKPADQPDVPF
jgi:hypothetical protein